MPVRRLLVLLLPMFAAPVVLARAPDPLLRRLIERGHHPSIRWGHLSDVQVQARALYQRSGWAPLWLREGRPTRAARGLLDALATVGDRGLHPADYDAPQLAALAATLERRGADAEQAARFDAALSIAALRVVGALAHGRVPPSNAVYAAESRDARFDVITIVDQLQRTEQPGPLLLALEPKWPAYLALRRALVQYRALVRQPGALRLPRPAGGRIGAGNAYPGAAALRRLLAALGDLDAMASAPRLGDSVLTAELCDGLRRFQARQGGPVDGALSEATRLLLGSHVARRIRQMELALERWRWLPRGPDEAPLVVSLPARRLLYEDPATPQYPPLALRMRVGSETGCTRVPTARAALLHAVVLRPRDRALGSVVLPTRETGLFLHGGRPESGFPGPEGEGCLRVADGETLAELLLRRRGDWPGARIREVLAADRPVQVSLRRSVPLLVVYATAVARENGQVFFYPDESGQDRLLERRLAAGYPY